MIALIGGVLGSGGIVVTWITQRGKIKELRFSAQQGFVTNQDEEMKEDLDRLTSILEPLSNYQDRPTKCRFSNSKINIFGSSQDGSWKQRLCV